jgi:hypothetical protein
VRKHHTSTDTRQLDVVELKAVKLDATGRLHEEASTGIVATAASIDAVLTPPSRTSDSHGSNVTPLLHTNLDGAAVNPPHEYVTNQSDALNKWSWTYRVESADTETGDMPHHEAVLQHVVATMCSYHRGRLSRMLAPYASTEDTSDGDNAWFMRWALDSGMQEHAVVLINPATELLNLARRCTCTLP